MGLLLFLLLNFLLFVVVLFALLRDRNNLLFDILEVDELEHGILTDIDECLLEKFDGVAGLDETLEAENK